MKPSGRSMVQMILTDALRCLNTYARRHERPLSAFSFTTSLSGRKTAVYFISEQAFKECLYYFIVFLRMFCKVFLNKAGEREPVCSVNEIEHAVLAADLRVDRL